MKNILGFILLILFTSACNLPEAINEPNQAEANITSDVSPNLSNHQNDDIYSPPEDIQPATWQSPPLGASWQWQLSEYPIETGYDALVYDIDYEESSEGEVSFLKDEGHYVICYISVGSWEEWREDANEFPASVLGNKYDGWPGERWLDIRQIEALAPILEARMDLCKAKGFDGIEPDNIAGYTNDTGFPLTYDDQLKFNLWLAQEAHERGLSIGLKNDEEQVADLVTVYDWAMIEDCFYWAWCEALTPFIDAGKPVFAAEYTDTGIDFEKFCQLANNLGLSPILKDRDLTEWVEYCP